MKFIVTADWHLRSDLPRCRRDKNWIETQKKILDWLYKIYKESESTLIYVVGDVFHTSSEWGVLSLVLAEISKFDNIIIIPGNHDLKYHTQIKNTPFEIVQWWNNGKIRWGFTEQNEVELSDINNLIIDPVQLIHTLVWKKESDRPHPDAGGIVSDELFKRYPKAKWILTGDNHQSFHIEKEGSHIINPGCLIRQKANEIDYVPCVYLVDTEAEAVKKIPVPDDESIFDDTYLKESNEREEQIAAFVSSLKNNSSISLSFRDNVEDHLKKGNIDQGTKDLIIEIMEECK